MNGALSKEIENGSKVSYNSWLSWMVVFWKEDEVCGCRNKWRGPPWAHEAGGRALDPRGQVLAPPVVFSVPDILKYSRKKHTKFAGHLEHFYFRIFFIAWINQKTDEILFLLYLI